MKRKSEIDGMMLYSNELMENIEAIHKDLLNGNGSELKFQINIKFFLELMSSCLDYLALDIYEMYGKGVKINSVYFPFIEYDNKYKQNEEMIDSEIRLIEKIKETIGENASKDLALVHKLRNYQHIYHQNHNIWVTDFKKLRNHNTHRNLSVVKIKNDNNRIIGVSGGHKMIFIGEHSGFSDRNKMYRTQEELESFTGQPVSIEITRYYVVFNDVNEINKEAIKFLKSIKHEVESIVKDLYSFLESKNCIITPC